jgi:glutaminase
MVTAKELATMGASIANNGENPFSHKQVMPAQFVPKLLAVMITAGLYDQSGYWNYTVSVPGKSGVGGGILAIVPHQYAIAIFSPPLNPYGNSVRGIAVMQFLSSKLHLNLYAQKAHHTNSVT